MPEPGPIKPCPLCRRASSVVERTLNDTRLVRCPACEFVYADLADAVIDAANSGYGEEAAACYEAMQSSIDRAWFAFVADRLTRSSRRGSVLDVGCGNGLLLKEFLDRGWEAHGVDVSPWSTVFAARYGFTLHRLRIEDDGLPAEAFDVVTSTSALEHIAQPRPHVRAILRVLRPGGIAYFGGMPNYGSLAVRIGFSAFHHNTPPGHANYFTPGTLRRLFQLLREDGFRGQSTVRTYGIPELHYWRARFAAAFARCAGTRRGGAGPRAPGRGSTGGDTRTSGRLSGSLVARVYYYAGGLFQIGEALEAVCVKDSKAVR